MTKTGLLAVATGLGVALLVPGCGGGSTSGNPDAGAADAANVGASDAAAIDAASSDAAGADAATLDASSTRTSDCFASPGACGFPDPSYPWNVAAAWQPGGGGVGPNDGVKAVACSSLPSSGSITTSSDGQVIKNLNVTGTIQVKNANVTIENVCVTNNGGAMLGSDAIKVTASGVTIENSIIAGANNSTQSVEAGVLNFGGSSNVVTLKHDYIHACGECLNTGSWNVSDSYILNDGMYGTTDHLETMYIDGSGNTVTVNHSTLFTPPGYTDSASPFGYGASVLFGDTNGGSGGACSTKWTVTNNLLAGDGFIIYQCGNSSSVGSSTLTFTGNDIARCHGAKAQTSGGNWYCTDLGIPDGSNTNRGGDGYGFYPFGGSYGVDTAYCSSATWTGNYWDDTGDPIGC